MAILRHSRKGAGLTVEPAHTTEGCGGMRPAVTAWEVVLVTLAVLSAVALGAANLGAPSLWHDELVHVFVARSIVETGRAALPSGHLHGSAPLFSSIVAGVVALWGDGEAAVRAPSVVFGALCVALTYVVVRPLLGRAPALAAVWLLAWSPWSVAWSREARFYAMQQMLYLAMLWAVWRMFAAEGVKRVAGFGLASLAAFVAGVFAALHSVLFLAAVGLYASALLVADRARWRRWLAVCVVVGVLGVGTIAAYRLWLPQGDSLAIFKEAGIGAGLNDPLRAERLYYLRWLWQNLGAGYLALALVGLGWMVWREGRRGLFVALSFWGPVLVLTFLVGYRRPR
ncbi:MAG TPA: hypothetical protein ENN80_05190, partial [Candidatus Hydrogenedentes bacterium]|nr:hypothetical protein [Candidatus Hydrogenedentota bacterium]